MHDTRKATSKERTHAAFQHASMGHAGRAPARGGGSGRRVAARALPGTWQRDDGSTVLHRACENGDPDTLHVLLKHGGSPNVRRRSSLAGVDVVAALPQRWVAASGTRGGGLRWARSFVKRPTCGPPIEVGTAILPAHDARILRVVLLTWIGTRRFDSSHIRSQERSNSPQCGVRQCGSAQQQCGVRSAECTHSGVGWPSTG